MAHPLNSDLSNKLRGTLSNALDEYLADLL